MCPESPCPYLNVFVDCRVVNAKLILPKLLLFQLDRTNQQTKDPPNKIIHLSLQNKEYVNTISHQFEDFLLIYIYTIYYFIFYEHFIVFLSLNLTIHYSSPALGLNKKNPKKVNTTRALL